ncbi:MAG: hypothetical protein HKL99_14360 [Burkholderiales bacterium]|nr:hypothetical protein [Burkholderiales bacterium]
MPATANQAVGTAVAAPATRPCRAYGISKSTPGMDMDAPIFTLNTITQASREARAAEELQLVRDAMAAALASYFEQHAARIALYEEAREVNRRRRAPGSPKMQMPAPLPPLGILATVGLGKSVGVTPVVGMAHSAGLPLVILVPTHQLAQEYAERLKPFGAVVYQGRREPSQSQPNEAPSDPGAHACYRLERVADAGDQNHRPAQGLCGKCPNGQAGVLQFVSRDQMRLQRAADFFKARGMDPAKTPPCQFLFRGLPDQLSARILVAPIAAFSQAMGDWLEVDPLSAAIMRQAQRLVIVDEHIPMASEVEIDAGDIKVWRNRLDGLTERLEQTIVALGKKDHLTLTSAQTEELSQAHSMLELAPAVDKLFRDLGAQIAGDQPIDTKRVIDMQKRVTKAGGLTAGTAKWERVSYSHDDDDFFIPLRALSTLARNCQAGAVRQEKGTLFVYETSPIVEWARDRGSVIFLDATMSLAMRQFIQARGGKVHEATASQNMHVTRMTGHLYARGDVKKAAYPDEARAHLAEIRDLIAPQLPKPAAIITHMAYLRYSQEAHRADDAAQVAAQQFEADTGVPVGWYGRHDRGLDCWGGRHLALVGMPLLPENTVAGLYAATRAALADCGIQWPAWDKVMDKEKPDADGPPLPVMAEARAWLLDEYSQTLAQAIGRNRAVNRPRDAAPLQVQLWGGIQTVEMDSAMAKYGVVIHDRVRNPRSVVGPKPDLGAVDEAIEMVRAAGQSVSVRSVRAALVGLHRSASTESIQGRLKALRSSGDLPAATRVRSEEVIAAALAHIPTEATDPSLETVAAAHQREAHDWTQLQGQEKMEVGMCIESKTSGLHTETTVPNSHKDTNSGNSEQCCTTTEPQTQGQEKIFFAPAFDLTPTHATLTDDELEAMLLQVADAIDDELARDVAPDDDPDPDRSGGGPGVGRKGRLGGNHGHLMGLAERPHTHHNTWRGSLSPPPLS